MDRYCATRFRSFSHPKLAFGMSILMLGVLAALASRAEAATGDAPSRVANIVEQTAARVAAARGQRSVAGAAGLSNDIVHVSPSGEIELLFHAIAATGASEEADLEALGARIVGRLAPGGLLPGSVGMIQAWVPADQVAAAASLPWVVAVTPPDYGSVNVGPNLSEGVALHDADLAQLAGIDGTGVNVGAMSDGVDNLAAAQGAGELPTVTVLTPGSGDEGTAMLEIIHDMAPGASLFFTKGTGVMDHVNGLAALVAAGVNVIAEDLAFDGQPAFQQGAVASARESTAAGGVSVHSSSGNRGVNHAARVAAVGTGGGPDGVVFGATPPGCTNTPDNVVAIAPGGDTTFDVVLGQMGAGSTSITLQWSEPRSIFPTVGQGGFTNLNLYVMDAALTQCLAEAVGVQANGVGDTIEQISIDLPGTAAKIVVDVEGTSSAVAAPVLDLRWRNMQSQTDTPTRAGSNDPDKNYTGLAWAIGAVDTAGVLTNFSSAGPVDFLTTTMCPGGGLGPCMGVAGPAGQTFQGLDFLGANGVQVSGVGGFGAGTCPAVNPGDCLFFGTSAAAPHTAACDALVRDVIGAAAAPADVRERLALTAIDYPPAGEDSVTGAGRVDCFAAVTPAHFQCYKTAGPPVAPRTVSLVDQFESGSFDVLPSYRLFCNPAEKNGGGIFDADSHLTSYRIRKSAGQPKFQRVRNIQIDNQFGTITVNAIRPARLLVPSSKSLQGPPPPLQGSTLDHFKCYKIEPTQPFTPIVVSVLDQFNQPTSFSLNRPELLCNPVDKNNEGINDPVSHLLCYHGMADVRHQRVDLFLNDQFEAQQLQTRRESMLCVPSVKTLP